MPNVIWLMTWNCENQFPDDGMLRATIPAMIATTAPANRPDIIAIGLQEGMSSGPLGGAARGASMGGHVGAAVVLGILTAGVANAIGAAVGAASRATSRFDWISERVADMLTAEYVHLGTQYMDGMTKGICNYQQLGIIAKRTISASVQGLTFVNAKAGIEGKGGAPPSSRSSAAGSASRAATSTRRRSRSARRTSVSSSRSSRAAPPTRTR